jgi:hypothetical protein
MCARFGLSLAVVAVFAAFAGASSQAIAPPQPRVLLIGDSVATGMQWHPDAVTVLQKNLAFTWQVAVCRRLTGVSCPFQGQTPPNLVDLVGSLGSVPPVVVVEMGYNDFQNTFAASVEQSIQTLLRHGAQHILWLTIRQVRHPFVQMDAVLTAAAKRHPQVQLVDWNLYSRSHPEWFQTDGLHLVDSGGVAMATLIHLAIDKVVDPLKIGATPTETLNVDVPYAVRFAATGGEPPYHWQLVGSPPRGLHLLASGRLYGTPLEVQRVALIVRVSDTEGQVASRRLQFSVGP